MNEEGSEAAAATAAIVSNFRSFSPIEQWKADRPFLFMLRDKLTGMTLFQGRVVDPKA